MPNKILFDTCVLVDALRAYKPAVEYVEKYEEVNISIITAMELIKGSKNKAELNYLSELIDGYNVEPLDSTISIAAESLVKIYHLKNNFAIGDALIAATCLSKGYSLATRDLVHFENITGLDIVVPF